MTGCSKIDRLVLPSCRWCRQGEYARATSCSTRKGESCEMFSWKWLHRLLIHGCPMTHVHWRRRYDMCTPQSLVSSKKRIDTSSPCRRGTSFKQELKQNSGEGNWTTRTLSPAKIYIWAKSVLSYANGACEKGPRTRTRGRARVKFQEINQSIR
jgi:hypothetical protein